MGGGAKNGGKTPAKQRQQRQDESWSDDGTAYQDEYTTDVDLSEEEAEGHRWEEAADDEYESSGEHAVTPRASRWGRIVLVLSCSFLTSEIVCKLYTVHLLSLLKNSLSTYRESTHIKTL